MRAEFPDLKALRKAPSIDQYEILANFDDNCYNSDFLEQEYGELVRSLISGCLKRGQLDRRGFQDSFRSLIDKAELTPNECIEVALNVLRERFSAAALNRHETAMSKSTPMSHAFHDVSAQVSSESDIALPAVAPELYENRIRPESPIDYYDRVWRKYADAGVLYQDQLRKLDPKLIPAVHTYCSKRELDAKLHLPPPRHERTKQLAQAGDPLAVLRTKQAKWNRSWRQRQAPEPR